MSGNFSPITLLKMKSNKYSDFYLEICKYYGYVIEDDKFVLTPEIYEEVLKYYGYKMENGNFVKKPKIPEFEYFGKWKNWGFRP